MFPLVAKGILALAGCQSPLSQHFDYTATYDPFRFLLDNAKWIVPLVAVLLILGCFTLLLFVRPLWNLYLYRRFTLDKIGDISIPAIGDLLKAVLRALAVLPWFVKRPGSLDAWIQHNLEALATTWNNDVPRAPPNRLCPSKPTRTKTLRPAQKPAHPASLRRLGCCDSSYTLTAPQ